MGAEPATFKSSPGCPPWASATPSFSERRYCADITGLRAPADEQRARERLVFGLRMLEGIDAEEFLDQTGLTIDSLVRIPLRKFVTQHLLRWNGPRLCLTREGLLISDSMWPEFLNDLA